MHQNQIKNPSFVAPKNLKQAKGNKNINLTALSLISQGIYIYSISMLYIYIYSKHVTKPDWTKTIANLSYKQLLQHDYARHTKLFICTNLTRQPFLTPSASIFPDPSFLFLFLSSEWSRPRSEGFSLCQNLCMPKRSDAKR